MTAGSSMQTIILVRYWPIRDADTLRLESLLSGGDRASVFGALTGYYRPD